MSGKDKDEQRVLIEIDQITTKLKKHPKNLNYVCRLASLHLDDNKVSRSQPYMIDAIKLYKENKESTIKQGIDLTETMVKFWKADKYVNKQEMRTNLSTERDKFLQQTHDIIKHVINKKDEEFSHLLSLRMAYIKECKGDFQESLALLSDLIAEQAMDHVDLSYIIFKAAIILMHIGQPKQAIEYLEFIMDDPPTQDGFTKAHLCAFIVHVYERSGDKYKVFLPKGYKELQQAFSTDMPAAYSKLLRTQGKSGFGQGSELWEMLALQALERCEYVLAAEFLVEAISKVPGKVKLMFLLAEVYALLKQKAHAKSCAEQAYELNPQSSELRNLLLQVAPEEWTEKLRVLSSTTNARSTAMDTGGSGDNEMDMEEIANAYAPPASHQQKLGGNSSDGYAPGADATVGAGNIAAPPTSLGYKSADKEVEEEEAAAQESSSWVSKMRSKAGGALKAMHTGAVVSSPNTKKAAAPNSTAASATATAKDESRFSPVGSPSKPQSAAEDNPAAVAVSSLGQGKGQGKNEASAPVQRWFRSTSPTPPVPTTSVPDTGAGAINAADTHLQEPQQEQQSKEVVTPTPARPKSRSSFISMLMPSSPAPAQAPASASVGVDATERNQSPEPAERPKSRSSFISKIIPSSFRSPAPAPASSSPLSSAALANARTGNDQKSPDKSNQVTLSPSSKNRSTAPAPTSSSKLSNKVATRPKSKPQPKKITKYDTVHHASKLGVDDDDNRTRVSKPERPVLDEDERKMLHLILSGNENVPIYDQNLLVLQQLRSSKKIQ